MGRVLARVYTVLVHKKGPLGAFNMRPLTVMLVVYRLLAGVRLKEVME